jgi:hypothetical protein
MKTTIARITLSVMLLASTVGFKSQEVQAQADPEENGTSCEVSVSCGPNPNDYVKCSSSTGNCQRWPGSVTCNGITYWC